jgi:hypothetical protein
VSRRISAANAVGNAVEEACALYHVPCYRMNSRALTVVGKGGRERPMFFGQWRDRFGTMHRSGMPDYLLTPHVRFLGAATKIPIPVWLECKSGTGELTAEQKAFRDDVHLLGIKFLEVHDDASELISWFKAMEVR